MQLIQKLALSAVQHVLWCSCLDIASAMSQSSSYCFTNISSCCAGGFPSHLFPKLSARPSPLLFIKSDGRPHIGPGWLQGTIHATLALHLPCRRNAGYSFSGLTWEHECFEAVLREQSLWDSADRSSLPKTALGWEGLLWSALCSSVWLLCRTLVLSFQ